MVPCAYLRVFEPLDALSESERERWGTYVAEGRGLTVSAALQAEARLAVTRIVTGATPKVEPQALVRRVGRRIHLCPLELRERHAVALLAFREMLPEPAVRAFVSQREAKAALATVERLHRPPHIQESGWEVPLRWFAAFDPSERHFVNPPEADGPRLAYLTRAAAALGRLDRAIDVIETTLLDADEVVDALSDLVEWVANFHDDSLVELDYGGLARIIAPGELAMDSSCEDVWKAIDSLAEGDAAGATAGYESVAGRWGALRQRYREN